MFSKKKFTIASAPYRISLGGGGTDLPFYASKNTGHLISAAIDEYITVMVAHRQLDNNIFLQYSDTEVAKNISKVNHEILKEILMYFKISDSFQIATFSTMPTFTGLGASSVLIVAAIKAISNLFGNKLTNLQVAQKAFHVEREILGLKGGYQDQYISSLGGIQSIEVTKSLRVNCKQLKIHKDQLEKLQRSLYLVYSSLDRESVKIIRDQEKEVKINESKIFNTYDQIKDIGKDAIEQLKKGEIKKFGIGMDRHWKLKKTITNSISNSSLDIMYDKLKSLGALGGKIVGAGGGGFFLMVVDKNQNTFRKKVIQAGNIILDFKLDFEGVKIIY